MQPLHARIQPKTLTKIQHLGGRVRQLAASRLVGRVTGGDDGVQPVVAAVESDDCQDSVSGVERCVGSRVDQIRPVHLSGASRDASSSDNAAEGEKAAAGQGPTVVLSRPALLLTPGADEGGCGLCGGARYGSGGPGIGGV